MTTTYDASKFNELDANEVVAVDGGAWGLMVFALIGVGLMIGYASTRNPAGGTCQH